MPEPTTPEWIPVWHGRHEYLVRFADAENRNHDWHVAFDNFDGTGRRKHMAWHAWPDIPEPDVWDKPVWLSRRIGEAKNEFLVRVVHSWQPGYGFAEDGAGDAVYGKGGRRRERRFIVAELTGRGICARCGKSMTLWGDGCIRAHNRPRGLDRCAGSHQAPAVEPTTFAHLEEGTA
jgi:hypothetical protein